MKGYFRDRPWLSVWLASTLFGLALVYALIFALQESSREECELRNTQIVEVNDRVDEINGLADSLEAIWKARVAGDQSIVAEGEVVARSALRDFRRVQLDVVPRTDCEQTYSDPFPFN